MGPNPISYLEISAWAGQMKRRPEPWEVRAIKQLDALFMDACVEAQKAKAKKADPT